MEYLGQTKNATYTTYPRTGSGTGTNFRLPVSTAQSSYKAYDTSAREQSLGNAPLRSNTYYPTDKPGPATPSTVKISETQSMKNQLSQLDSVKVPTVFPATRNALNTRYTPNDWVSSNQSNFLASDRVRSGSQLVRSDTARLCRDADDKTKKTQNDVSKKLRERLDDIQFWKKEVNNEIDNMVTETDSLKRSKGVLEKALADTERPLQIAQECLTNREKRQGIDLVHDNVEKQLIKEVETLKTCQEEMRKLLQDSNYQLALNRAAHHELEKDSTDKFTAMNLDNACHQLRDTSRGLRYQDGVQRIDNTITVPETWAKFSNENIQRSQRERAASRGNRNKIESLLNKCAAAMISQWNTVNNAFTDRIKEGMDAKQNLQNHLSQVLQEIFDAERNIELLKKTTQDKEAPMKVAQTRLSTRAGRPNVEMCRDPVQQRLVTEVSEIESTVENLNSKLREAEGALQQLLRTKSSLEQDLSVKNNSLFIDREKCMGLRKTFPMSPRVSSY